MEESALSAVFPDARFAKPATFEAIARAEAELGVLLPEQLRALYLESDGFRESKGNASYLLPLEYLVDETHKLWTLHEVLTEAALPDFKPFVFFGSPSGGGWWGIRHAPPFDIVAWDHHMLYEPDMDYETYGQNIIEAFRADYAQYEAAQPHD